MLNGIVTYLRAIEKADLPQLLEWRNKTFNRGNFREWRLLNSEHQEIWFNQHVMSSTSPIMFAIVEQGNNKLLGACGLTYIDWIHRTAEISIYIGEGYVDELYCPDAMDVLCDYGFKNIGLHRLWIAMYSYDKNKKKLAEDCGFIYEGTLREAHFFNGKFYDEHIYGKLANEQI